MKHFIETRSKDTKSAVLLIVLLVVSAVITNAIGKPKEAYGFACIVFGIVSQLIVTAINHRESSKQ